MIWNLNANANHNNPVLKWAVRIKSLTFDLNSSITGVSGGYILYNVDREHSVWSQTYVNADCQVSNCPA